MQSGKLIDMYTLVDILYLSGLNLMEGKLNKSYFPLKIKATSRISIPHGCSVELTNHSIHSDFTLRIQTEAIHFEWDFNPARLPNSAKLLEETKHIDAHLVI